jgi:molecular chaperone GrpE
VSDERLPEEEVLTEAAAIVNDAAAEEDPRSDVERERDEFKALAQRQQADFENYRRRVLRDADDAASRAAASVAAKILPVIDALDLAQAHFGTADIATLESVEAKALVQARALLLDTLTKEGLERIDAVQVTFDPQVHDAVAHVEGDGEGQQLVDEVLRAGYRWKGVVLRAAMVRVRG